MFGGVAADATVNGVAFGALGFWAITGAGVTAGGGDSSFCFLPHLLPFGGGVGLASFSFLATTRPVGGVPRGIACSTRTNSFAAGGGVALGLMPGMDIGPPCATAAFFWYSASRCSIELRSGALNNGQPAPRLRPSGGTRPNVPRPPATVQLP